MTEREQAFIPYGTQWVDEDDVAAVVEVLRGGFLTQGPAVEAFEAGVADYVGSKYCIAFCNGTAALQCAVRALDLPAGSEGITSANTFVASANCMPYNNIKPSFADVDPSTFNVTSATLESSLTEATKLMIPVHFAGQAVEMEPVSALASQRGVRVIEDAAHAIGSTYADGSMVGNCRYSDMTMFSFHPVKSMTMGEGGCITTNDLSLDRRLRLLRTHGITKDSAEMTQAPGPWYYEMQELSYNFRVTDMQCALGLSQLKKMKSFKARRREIVSRYNEAFEGMNQVGIPVEREGLSSCFHLYVLQVDFDSMGLDRAQVMVALNERGIGCQVLYIPVYLHPWYRKTYGYQHGMCPAAEAYYAKTLSLPLFPKMKDSDVERVIEGIKDLLAL